MTRPVHTGIHRWGAPDDGLRYCEVCGWAEASVFGHQCSGIRGVLGRPIVESDLTGRDDARLSAGTGASDAHVRDRQVPQPAPRPVKQYEFGRHVCAACGEVFEATGGAHRYCSEGCRQTATFTARTCPVCRGEFRREGWSRVRFCSPRCAATYTQGKRKFAEKKCQRCGKTYQPATSRAKYCSTLCANRERAKRARRAARAAAPWGLSLKGELLCRNCLSLAVHLHHIVPRSRSKAGAGDIAGNGMPLCFDCHRGWHDRRITLYRGCLTEAEIAASLALVGGAWLDRNYPVPGDVQLIELAAALNPPGYFRDGWQQRNRDRMAAVRDVRTEGQS